MAREMKDSGIEWIGEIPADWDICRFKNICEINNEFVDPRTGEYDNLPHIGPGNIEKFTGRLTDYKLVKQEGLISGKYHFYPHELVYGKINPQLGKVAFPQFEGLCSADAYAIHMIDDNMFIKYLFYYMLTKPFINETVLESLRMGMPKINSEDLMKLRVLLPNIEEQKRIIVYLDRICSIIDSVIDKTRASVDEYKKLKQAVITQAVTKGIRPDRQMKDSGIEWIGEIPEEWNIISHKYVMHKEKDICEHYNGEDIISLSMNGVRIRDLDAGGKMPTTFDGYQYVEPEDMLLCLFDIDVTPRCVGIVKNYGVTSPAYSRFIIHNGYCNRYYDYLLRFIDDKKIFVHLAKNLRSSLTETDFGVIKTIVPNYQEQQEIADYLDNKCASIDILVEQKEKILNNLENYKKSLIYEYVTGKKEVPA